MKNALHRLLLTDADESVATPTHGADLDLAVAEMESVSESEEATFEGNPFVQLHYAGHVRLLGSVNLHGVHGDYASNPDMRDQSLSCEPCH